MSLKVGLYKMDGRSEARLRIIFKMVYKNQCSITDISKSDVVIINVEKQNEDELILEFTSQFSDKTFILLSDEFISIDNIRCITRPFKLPDLLDSLKNPTKPNTHSPTVREIKSENTADKKTLQSLDRKLATKTEKLKPSNIESSNEDIYYDPQKFLQGKIINAIGKANKLNKTVFLRCWSRRWVLISPSSGFLVENIKERQLASLGLICTEKEQDIVFREESFTQEHMSTMSETPVKDVKATPIDKFIWDIAVRTARGRIPKGESADDIYILKQWPNLTRVSQIPNSMRISAFWLDKPQSINNIAESLSIPIKDVFTFFSAGYANGLIKKAKRKEDKLIKPELSETKKSKKGLFSAILKKLSRISGNEKSVKTEQSEHV